MFSYLIPRKKFPSVEKLLITAIKKIGNIFLHTPGQKFEHFSLALKKVLMDK